MPWPRARSRTATISFGLVSIPVKLYSTSELGRQISLQHAPQEVRLAPQAAVLLPQGRRGRRARRDRQGLRVRQGPVRARSRTRSSRRSRRRPPARSRSPSSCRRARSTRSTSSSAYYLGPDKGGDKPYKLLAEAMRETGRCRARDVRRARQAVPGAAAAVRGRPGDAAAALRRRGAVVHRGAERGDAERQATRSSKLAKQLIEQIASDEFQPEKYKDEVQEAHDGGDPAEGRGPGDHLRRRAEEPQGKIIDLMEALKASLEETRRGKAPAARKGPKRAASAPRRRQGEAQERRAAGLMEIAGRDLRRPRGGRAHWRLPNRACARSHARASSRPQRGTRGELRFGFRDLAFLRQLRDLRGVARARAPQRVRCALAPPAGRARPARARARARRGASSWCARAAGTGAPSRASSSSTSRSARASRWRAACARVRARAQDADAWYQLGWELEAPIPPARAPPTSAPSRSCRPRGRAREPGLSRARGGHGSRRRGALPRRARARAPTTPPRASISAVVLEDQQRSTRRATSTRPCLARRAACAEAHHNLARLCERAGDRAAALRHWVACAGWSARRSPARAAACEQPRARAPGTRAARAAPRAASTARLEQLRRRRPRPCGVRRRCRARSARASRPDREQEHRERHARHARRAGGTSRSARADMRCPAAMNSAPARVPARSSGAQARGMRASTARVPNSARPGRAPARRA